MSKKKFDLGAMIAGGVVPNLDTEARREQIEYIHIDLIDDDPNNFYELSDIDELAANIEMLGLQQPLRVRANPDNTERVIIVSGHRRRRAIRKLVDEGRKDLAEIPCIREVPAESAALQELRLIYANSDTRKMTTADISKQAERVEMLLYKLKEEGYEFPGRMRDHVAEACKVSKSKLARLKVIREGLSSDFIEAFEKNTLSEQAAYAISRFPLEFQHRLFRVSSIAGLRGYSVEAIQRLYESGKRWEPQLTCPDGKSCTHGDAALRHDLDEHYNPCCGERCCLTCPQATRDWSPCERMCSKAKAQRKANKEAEEKKAAAEQRKRANKYQMKTQENAQRLLKAIDASGVSDKTELKWGYYGIPVKVSEVREYADGQFDGDDSQWNHARLSAEDLHHPIEVAKKLGCSADYLLGLSDELHPAAGTAAPESNAVRWYPRSVVPAPGSNIVVIDDLGCADNGIYLKNGGYEGSVRWDEVVMWTLDPTEDTAKAPDTEPPAEGWLPLKWIPGKERPDEATQSAVALFKVEGADKLMKYLIEWNGSTWCFPHGATIDAECVGWFPLPKEDA